MQTIKIAELEFHPAAKLFPLLEGQEFNELVKDVRAHGVREPIHLLNGKLLDGRNRVRAAKRADLSEVSCVDLPPDTQPGGHVISMNILRRHLTARERIKLVTQALKEDGTLDRLKEEAAARKRSGKGADGSGGRGKKTLGQKKPKVSTTAVIADKAGVSVAIVKASEAVDKSGDAGLIESVDAGEIPVTTAAKQVKEKKKATTTQADAPKESSEPDAKIFGVWEEAERYLNTFVGCVAKLQTLSEDVKDLLIGTRNMLKQFKKLRKASKNGAVADD